MDDPILRAEVNRLIAARQSFPEVLQSGSLAEALHLDDPVEIPSAGTLIAERYRLQEMLSRTPGSIIFVATDERLASNRVVVKFFDPSGRSFESLQRAVRNEIEALARLREPSVAGLIDGGVWEGKLLFVVMQYMPGRSLRERLEANEVTPAMSRAVLTQVAATLDAAHRAGIVHCDLKPENIIVETSQADDIRVSVVDFGIARAREGLDAALGLGTPAYAAPEQLTGGASARSDVYALARIAEELFPKASPRLRRAIERGLDPDPNRRPATLGELVQGLDRAARPWQPTRWAVAAAIALAGALVTWRAIQGPASRAGTSPSLRSLTTLKGVELEPSFSPDGDRLLFSHGEGQESWRRIYVSDLDGRNLQPVTFGNGRDHRPVSSRDGRYLAYLRESNGQLEIRLQSSERDSRTIYKGEVQSVCFGPNSNILFFSALGEHKYVIHRFEIDTGRIDTLQPPPQQMRDIDVSLSPDGRSLAFVRYETLEKGDVYIAGLTADGRFAGEPNRVTWLDRRVFHPAWYPDGRSLLFVAGTLSNHTLWKSDLGEHKETRELKEYGDQLESVAISKRQRMVLVRNREDSDIWEFRLKADGEADLSIAPRRLYSSTSFDEEPRFSPDGTRLAFFSERSGEAQAYLATVGEETVTQLTRLVRAEKSWTSWSSTGNLSLFSRTPASGPELLRADGATNPRRVFVAPATTRVVGISNDGHQVYVTPEDEKTPRLERWNVDSGRREFLARVEAGFLRESEDGRYLYYTRRKSVLGLFRMPRDGGREERVVESLARRNTFTMRNGWLYYAVSGPTAGIYAKKLPNGPAQLLFRVDRLAGWGLDVSPDGTRLVMPINEMDDADILVHDGPLP